MSQDKYAKFRELWEEAGRRNAVMRAYTEDHGPGWWISQVDSDAIALRLRAMRISELASRAFVDYYSPHFPIYFVGSSGRVQLIKGTNR